jgi:hypothetical protein
MKEEVITIRLPKRTINYVNITAFNRFIDNVNKALKGDEECRSNLLSEDLGDMYEHGTTVWKAIQDKK